MAETWSFTDNQRRQLLLAALIDLTRDPDDGARFGVARDGTIVALPPDPAAYPEAWEYRTPPADWRLLPEALGWRQGGGYGCYAAYGAALELLWPQLGGAIPQRVTRFAGGMIERVYPYPAPQALAQQSDGTGGLLALLLCLLFLPAALLTLPFVIFAGARGGDIVWLFGIACVVVCLMLAGWVNGGA
jgi:hypothetical protein